VQSSPVQRRRWFVPATVVAFVLAVAIVAAGSRAQTVATAPLPDRDSFIATVKAKLRSDRALQAQYTFVERREEIDVSKLGKVKKGAVKTYEVYPSLVPGNTYKRLIAVDGVPISHEELERNDAKHRSDVLRDLNAPPEQRAKRERENAKLAREEHEAIEEAFALYDIQLVGRELVSGYPTIVATLEPRRNSKPRTEDGEVMKKFRVRAWVHEQDAQVVKLNAEAIEDLTFGWGLIGRLRKGATFTFERTKVNGEVWLPIRMRVTGSGRALVFRGFSIDSRTEWSDYRKFAVKTDEAFTNK
jgi:hypothetical protein